jgi:tetratricopeptide (TPR) repeat protein
MERLGNMTRAPRLFERTPASNRSPRSAIRTTGAACAVVVLAALCVACGGGIHQSIQAPELTEENRELYARTNLEHARALHREGRLEHAEGRTRRGLGYQPKNVQLLRTRAEILDDMDRGDEAIELRERADAIDPPAEALPTTPHARFGGPAPTVLLLPPSPALRRSTRSGDRVPQTWPDGEEAQTLSQRVSTRLHGARVMLLDEDDHPAATLSSAAAFLDREAPSGVISIRIDRAYCGNSVKDGRFAVAWLRVAAASPGEGGSKTAPHLVRTTVEHPPSEGCKAVAIGQAFEQALELEDIHAALAANTSPEHAHYAAAAARSLFPVLEWRVGEQVAKGRRYLAVGELGRAEAHFQRAVEIDPEDAAAAGFLDEVTRSLAVASQLETTDTAPSSLDPQLSAAQRTGMEAQLAYETQRREEMLSALAVLYETRNAPTPGTVANMRLFEVRDPSAIGVALAMGRVEEGSTVEVKTLFAPDGAVLARYYFPEGSTTPVLREDDTGGDGVPDRWVGYEDGLIREVWESDGTGPPTLHIVYVKGGSAIERIEFDHNGTGEVDRVFVYAAGVLQDEAWDTNGDGSFDRFQQFDESGSLTMREEDVDGDAEIDVRTAYNNGRIVRREILNSELLTELQ